MNLVLARLRPHRSLWLAAAFSIGLLGFLYFRSLAYMVHLWAVDEDYGHGFFVPWVSLFLIWQRRERLRLLASSGSWWGVPVLTAGVLLYLLGEFSTLYVLVHLSLLIVVIGLVLSEFGGKVLREIAVPLSLLLTVIPLPDFLYQGLSHRLQLLSSQLGVGCLQVMGVTAYREGNVIDLGPIQLQVVEACSGLRYLFPLVTLALITTYLWRGPIWKRGVLFLSSFPIAIFLNGFRIGMTGLLVDFYGERAAEGFFHSFSGWFLFVISLLLFLGEMWLLSRVGKKGEANQPIDRPVIEVPRSVPEKTTRRYFGSLSPAYLFCLILLVPVMLFSTRIETREDEVPQREGFIEFPMKVGSWEGKSFPLEEIYIKALRFDDYLLADFHNGDPPAINLYIAYYQSQRKGRSTHSPRTCIPGGGWEITSLERVDLNPAAPEDGLAVNRAIIQKGRQRQVVFYWFQQRGRILTNEYLVKFYLFWDALTRHRTDGALVRLTAPLPVGASEEEIDGHLTRFATELRPLLARYIPL